MSEPDWAPLTGFRVAVTSARRADELSALLQRRGATVTSAAAITMVPLPDDDELRVNTEALIDLPPDVVIATTGIGFRGWVAAADGWGLANELIAALGKARIVSRGPKATGALRAAGLPEEWSPESESSRELLHYLVEGGIAGARIAVQLHGATATGTRSPSSSTNCGPRAPKWCRSACTAGTRRPATASSTNWSSPSRSEKFDAVSFTSAPAVASVLLRAARWPSRTGCSRLCAPMCTRCASAPSPRGHWCGSACRHRRLSECGWARWSVTSPMSCRCCAPARWVAGHLLEIRGTCVLVDGVVKAVSPAGMATIRALAHHPGAVVSRNALLGALPGSGTDTHAVETAVLRLRTALGDKNIVSTVVKRGYRLAVDENPAQEHREPRAGRARHPQARRRRDDR